MERMTLNKPLRAWHFGNAQLGFGDGRRVRVGVRQRFRPSNKYNRLVMCECGMHASVDIRDALSYARGTLIRRVELSGEVLIDSDKVCAEFRKSLWVVAGETILRRFGCHCALDVVDLWSPPAPKVVLRYLRTQDKAIRHNAADAARAAADADSAYAARAAAYAAADAAAYAADAADAAARAAAYADSAADAAARAAAYAAAAARARTRQQRRLLAMVYAAKRSLK